MIVWFFHFLYFGLKIETVKEEKAKGNKYMIKTRLVKLLSHTKKYIVQMVLWQWIALLGQIAAIVPLEE